MSGPLLAAGTRPEREVKTMVKSGKQAKIKGGLAESPSHLMHRVLQLSLDIYAEEAGPDGLTQRQFAVLEAVSVIVQVVSFKLTGRRVFKMAPLHHHFELKGWAEPKVIVRFWIITVILVLVGLATLKLR